MARAARVRLEREGLSKSAPTQRPACGTYGGYRSHEYHHEEACDLCTDARRAYLRSSARRVARSRRYRSRPDAEADEAFARLRPNGKRCVMCGEALPLHAFVRDRGQADGRHRYCTANGCKEATQRAKLLAALSAHWVTLGIDPTRCVYCLRQNATDVEHFYPRAIGGSDEVTNLLPSCASCNRGPGGKHDKEPFGWVADHHPDRLAFFKSLFPQ